MPSYNIRCFASEQQVTADNLCRIMPVTYQSSFQGALVPQVHAGGHSTCAADNRWRPAAGFMRAEYTGNGAFRLLLADKERSEMLTFLHALLRRSVRVPPGPSHYHDIGFELGDFMSMYAPALLQKLDGAAEHQQAVLFEGDYLDDDIGVCWDYLELAAEEQQLYLRAQRGELQPVDFAVLHEDVYRELVASQAARTGAEGGDRQPVSFLASRLEAVCRLEDGQEPAEAAVARSRLKERAWRSALTLLRATSELDRFNAYPRGIEAAVLQQLCEKLLSGACTLADAVEHYLPFLCDRYAVATLQERAIGFEPLACPAPDHRLQVQAILVQAQADSCRRHGPGGTA